MKTRIIPTVLTDGLTVVKGEKFDNWRTVGSAEATARLYASRDVDELLFLDVTARSRNSLIDKSLLTHFASVLDVPFSVGGGINTLEDAKFCFRFGAEKIILGTAAIRNPKLITEIADVFGNQAIIVAIDFEIDFSNKIRIESGRAETEVDSLSFIQNLADLGAGEILIQSIQRDGTLSGMDFSRISEAARLTTLPIIASGGAASLDDFYQAVLQGASAVSAGAIFQFTEITPKQVKYYLSERGVQTRITK
jgi:imidazole glycerol-phosphate synthase subunit HisF